MSSPSTAKDEATIDFDVRQVMNRACEQASHSWEYGTAAEALLQLETPELSVFGKDPFPKGKLSSPDISKTPSLLYAKKFIRLGRETLIDADGGSCPLLMQYLLTGRAFTYFMWVLSAPSGVVVLVAY